METLSDWNTRTLAFCGDAAASNFGAQSGDSNEVIRAINDAVQEIWGLIVDADKFYYYVTYDLSTVADQEAYDLPVDFGRMLRLADREGTSSDEHGTDVLDGWMQDRGSTRRHDIRGQKIYFHKIPDDTVADKWRIHYARRIPTLSYGTAAAGSTLSLTLMSTPTYGSNSAQNDYYNNSRIYIASGTGAGTVATVTDFVGSTRVCTTGSGTFSTSSVYSIVPDLPESANRLVCAKAALSLLARVESPTATWLRQIERQDERRLVSLIHKRKSGMAPRMRLVPW